MSTPFVLPPRPKRRPPRLKGDFLGFLKEPAKCEYSREVLRFNASQKVFEKERVAHGYKEFRIALVKIEQRQEEAYKTLLTAHTERKKIAREYAERRRDVGLSLLLHSNNTAEEAAADEAAESDQAVPSLGDSKVEGWLKNHLKDAKNKTEAPALSVGSAKPVLPGIGSQDAEILVVEDMREGGEDGSINDQRVEPRRMLVESSASPRLDLHLGEIPKAGKQKVEFPKPILCDDNMFSPGKRDLKAAASPSAIKLVERKSKVLVVSRTAPDTPLVRQHSQEMIELKTNSNEKSEKLSVQISGPVVISDTNTSVVKPIKPITRSVERLKTATPLLPIIAEQEEDEGHQVPCDQHEPVKGEETQTPNPETNNFKRTQDNASRQLRRENQISDASFVPAAVSKQLTPSNKKAGRPQCQASEGELAPLEKIRSLQGSWFAQLPASGRMSSSHEVKSTTTSVRGQSKKRTSLVELNERRKTLLTEERKRILDAETPIVYMRDADGNVVNSGLSFKRSLFLLPSKRADRIRQGLLEAQKDAVIQQKVKMNQFLEQVSHDIARQRSVREWLPPRHSEPEKLKVDMPEMGATLTSYMNAFRQRLDVVEGEDADSYDAIVRNCRYVRRYRADDPLNDTNVDPPSAWARSS